MQISEIQTLPEIRCLKTNYAKINAVKFPGMSLRNRQTLWHLLQTAPVGL